MSKNTASPQPLSEGTVREVAAWRFVTGQGTCVAETCRVAVEAAVTIEVVGVGTYTLMATPGQARALAVGFAFTEGLVSNLRDIAALNQCEDDPNHVRICLARPPAQTRERTLPVVSSCGWCGVRGGVAELLTALPPVGDSLRLSFGQLLAAAEAMQARQRLFAATGGTHAAGVLDPQGELLALAEDLGRHNALDKALGHCLLAGQTLRGNWAILSGRLSLELVSKAARAGLELLAAVSAPSSLALEAAEACNITVCAFVRADRATVYTHPRRLGT